MLGREDVDAEALREGIDKLQQASMKMGEAIYKNAGSDGGGESQDADFEDVKEEEKEEQEEEEEEKDDKEKK